MLSVKYYIVLMKKWISFFNKLTYQCLSFTPPKSMGTIVWHLLKLMLQMLMYMHHIIEHLHSYGGWERSDRDSEGARDSEWKRDYILGIGHSQSRRLTSQVCGALRHHPHGSSKDDGTSSEWWRSHLLRSCSILVSQNPPFSSGLSSPSSVLLT